MEIRPLLCALFGFATLLASATELPPLDVAAPSAVIIDAESGEVLWSKDSDHARFPASTTKIMTALLLIEKCDPDDIITAPKGIETVKESSMHLVAGETVTARDMLYALLLRSANDGCVAVADHISGSVPEFVSLMNQRARQLGCTNTHFDNPNGLNDNVHTISAHDLAIIAREAMSHPEFADVVRLTKHKITRSINQKDLWMVSKNKWLRKDPSADGIKTGWTIPAGHCYVGSATRHGFRVITVVLHSEHWQLDHQKMLRWAFDNFERDYVNPPEAEFKVAAKTTSGATAWATLAKPTYLLKPKGAPPVEKTVSFAPLQSLADPKNPTLINAAVESGDRIGSFLIKAPGVSYWRPAVALTSYNPKAKKVRGPLGLTVPTLMIGGVLAGGALAMRKKARRMFSGHIS